MVMAAGVNFNNVWAARGVPVDVTKTQARWGEPTDFHIVGSDAAGVVYAVGDAGHERRGWATASSCTRASGTRTTRGCAPARTRAWRRASACGATTPAGARSRSSRKVQAHQCLPKADFLTWEEAAAPTLTGATAYRMLFGWPPHTVEPGDVVLVWGGSGGLGSLAIQLVANAGGRAVAVVGSDEKGEYCTSRWARSAT